MEAKNRAIEAFALKFGPRPTALAFAPGRVNLLGEHVDYNEGFVLPAALDRATWVAFSASASTQTTLYTADFDQVASFTPEEVLPKPVPGGSELPAWANYPAGVSLALRQAGLEAKGMQAAFASDVPRGAGLSSSASVEVAFAVAWQFLGGWSLQPMELALLCQRAENDYVGVQCGIMDQFASVCGREGRALFLDCRSLDWQTVPLPAELSIIIADTSVRRSLSQSGYNERRESCNEAVQDLSRDLPGIHSLRDVSLGEFNRYAHSLSPLAASRARHVVEEIERTRRGVDLLTTGDAAGFGHLMNECHASLRDLYQVSCPELDTMVAIAQSLEGCYGARLTGGGFGGCTVNLVQSDKAAGFARALAYHYQKETGRTPQVYTTEAGEGAGLQASCGF